MKHIFLPRSKPKEVKFIDPVVVERLAAEGLDQREIARRMGCAYGTFGVRLNKSKILSDAYRRGKERAKNNC